MGWGGTREGLDERHDDEDGRQKEKRSKRTRRTIGDVLLARGALVGDVHELVDLVLHTALEHLDLLEHDARLDRRVDAVPCAVTTSCTVLRAERGMRRRAVGERVTNDATRGEEGEGLEVGEHEMVFEREQGDALACVELGRGVLPG